MNHDNYFQTMILRNIEKDVLHVIIFLSSPLLEKKIFSHNKFAPCEALYFKPSNFPSFFFAKEKLSVGLDNDGLIYFFLSYHDSELILLHQCHVHDAKL